MILPPDEHPVPRPRRRRRTPKPMDIEKVQRWVASVILIHVGASPATALAVYGPHVAATEHSKGVALWAMSGVIGVLTVAGVLLIHRRRPLSFWLLTGLLPTIVGAFFF